MFGLFILIFNQNKILPSENHENVQRTTRRYKFCRQRGDCYRVIAANIGCGFLTAFRTLKRMDDTRAVNSRLRSGRPSLIKDSQRSRLKRFVAANSGCDEANKGPTKY